MYIPALFTKGAFSFSAPFDKDQYQKKILEVTAVRTLDEIYKNEEDPLNTIYLPFDMTEDDYNEDFQQKVPIISFKTNGSQLYYIPADRIIGLPVVNGVKYKNIMLTVSLGEMPVDYALDRVKNDVKDVLMDSLGIISEPVIVDASAEFLKTEDEHRLFMDRLAVHPRVKVHKSYKVKCGELTTEIKNMEKNTKLLETFMVNTWNNNVNQVTVVPPDKLKLFTKKIEINMVGPTRKIPVVLNNLLFYRGNVIGENKTEIFAKGFTKKNTDGSAYYGLLDKKSFSMDVTEGIIRGQHLPYIFSLDNYVKFEITDDPNSDLTLSRGSIVIDLTDHIYIKNYMFQPYISDEVYCGKIRIIMYNSDGEIISRQTYEYGRDFSATSKIVAPRTLQLQKIDSAHQPLDNPTS